MGQPTPYAEGTGLFHAGTAPIVAMDSPRCRAWAAVGPGSRPAQLRGFMSLNAAVIGGGISGLATAVRIAGLGARVTLYEGESFLGGLGTTFPYGDTHLERFYHCILPSDAALRRH